MSHRASVVLAAAVLAIYPFATMTHEASAASGAVARAAPVAARPAFRPAFRPAGAAFRHARRFGTGAFWPGGYWPGDSSYGGPVGEPGYAGAAQPSTDVHYTQTYDVPWDWAHRFPPAVTPSDRPYVQSCTEEHVTVPGRDGGDHAVNIMRCY